MSLELFESRPLLPFPTTGNEVIRKFWRRVNDCDDSKSTDESTLVDHDSANIRLVGPSERLRYERISERDGDSSPTSPIHIRTIS